MIGKIIVLLSASAITADEFKSLLQLFKCDDAPLVSIGHLVETLSLSFFLGQSSRKVQGMSIRKLH